MLSKNKMKISKIFTVMLAATSLMPMLFAGDKVAISAYGDYPTASCKIEDKYYLIPNGTLGEIIKWNPIYTDGKDKELYAQVDMFSKTEVKFLNGPQKGKNCLINHIYLQLK